MIDLGIVDIESPPEGMPSFRESTRRNSRIRASTTTAVAVLTSVFLLVGGAASPAVPLTRSGVPLVITEDASLTATERTVYVLSPDGQLRAHDPFNGHLRWKQRLPTPPSSPDPQRLPMPPPASPDTLPAGTNIRRMAPAEISTVFDSATGRRLRSADQPTGPIWDVTETAGVAMVTIADQRPITLALSSSDGKQLWQHAGHPIWRSASGDRAVFSVPAAQPTPTTAVDLVAISLRDGRPLWNHPGPGVPHPALDAVTSIGPDGSTGQSAAIVALGGGIGILNFADGSVRPLPPSLPVAPMSISGNLLLVGRDMAGRNGASGYHWPSLRPLWTLSTPDLSVIAAQPCGSWLCLWSWSESIAVDPTTGALRWRVDTLRVAGTGRVLGAQQRVFGYQGITVREGGNGQQVMDLPDWRPLLIGSLATRVPMVRLASPGRTAVAVLDLERPATYPVTEFSGRLTDCASSMTWLACKVKPNRVEVWKY